MYQRIMVPLDGSGFGEFALPHAIGIADRTGAEIDLVHVHIPEPDDLVAFTPYQYQHATQHYRDWDHRAEVREAEQLEERAARLAAETGLRITSRVLAGHVPEALEDEAGRFHADLIVMSTHARTGVDRIRQGSVSDVVVRRAAMPVLLVHPHEGESSPPPSRGYRRILISIDGSAFSEQVLDPAMAFARVNGAEMRLVHVLAPGGRHGSMQPRLEERAELRLETIAAERVAEGIREVAAHWEADVIAMATHGRGGLTRLLMGSTASEVIAITDRPVLLHRPTSVNAAREVVAAQA